MNQWNHIDDISVDSGNDTQVSGSTLTLHLSSDNVDSDYRVLSPYTEEIRETASESDRPDSVISPLINL